MRADPRALVALALFLPAFAMAFAAGLPAQPKLLPPEEAFRLSVRALDPSTIEARFDVADGYYLYRDRIHFSVGSSGNLPAELPRGQRKHDVAEELVVLALPATGAKPGPYVEAAPRKSWLK